MDEGGMLKLVKIWTKPKCVELRTTVGLGGCSIILWRLLLVVV